MINSPNHIIVGRFGRVFGVKGYITVHSYTDPTENIFDYKQWFALIDGKWQLITLLDKQLRPKSSIVLVEGYDQREKSASLVNAYIAIEKSSLPELPENQYYWNDLIGLKVINQQGIEFGVVKDLLDTGSNDVLIIEGERRRLVPFLLDRVICSVDLQEKTIIVDWDADI